MLTKIGWTFNLCKISSNIYEKNTLILHDKKITSVKSHAALLSYINKFTIYLMWSFNLTKYSNKILSTC